MKRRYQPLGVPFPGEALRQAMRADRARRGVQPKSEEGIKSWTFNLGKSAMAFMLQLLFLMGLAKNPKEARDIEEALAKAKRPEFLPRFFDACKATDKTKARYWLRRSMGLSGQ